MRIVLIEADRYYREFFSVLLEQNGHEVLTASDLTGCPVYDQADGTCPHEKACGDVLLIDQNMPKMTSLGFIQLQLERCGKGSVHNKAMMSDCLTRKEKELATRLGCTIFSKPFRLNSLLDWLECVEAKLPPERKLDCAIQ
jgi:DNA-binding response OmpR family regulator